MCTIKVRHFLAICVTAFPLIAGAQQAGKDAPPQPQPQPQLEQLDESQAPAVTIQRSEPQGKVVETRERGGRVSEIQITSGKSTYYVKPNSQVGSAFPGDTQSNQTRAPQWRLGGFDLRPSQDAVTSEAERVTAGTPPPPTDAVPLPTPRK